MVTIISLYKKIHSNSPNNAKNYIDITINICRTGFNLITLISMDDENIFITKFQNLILEVDQKLTEFCSMNFAKRQRMFRVEMILTIAFLIGSIAIKVYIHIILIVKDRFFFINSKLMLGDLKKGGGDLARNLGTFTRCHYLLCGAVECLNENFGWLLFGLIILIGLELIMGVNIIINFIISYNALYNIKFGFVILPMVLTSILFLGFGIMVVTSCEQTVRHACQTTEICYNLSLRYATMDRVPHTLNVKKLLEAVLDLAHQASHHTQNDYKSEQRIFFIQLILVNVVLLTLSGSRIFILTYFTTWGFAKCYIIHNLIAYIVGMEMMYINNSTLILALAMKTINKRLENLQNPLEGDVGDEVAEVRTITSVHIVLCDLIRSLNKAIGFRILLILLYTSTGLLHSVELLMHHWDEIHVRNISRILKTVSSCCLMVICVLLVSNCQAITKGMQKTSIISSKMLLENYSTNIPKKGSKIGLINESIYILALQSGQHRPVFTACGFFTINYSMLYNMFATILAYIVIVIQLTSTPNRKNV
ncbi:hypothetical protein Trydic_g15675 [Trypoxylus dichotomus]